MPGWDECVGNIAQSLGYYDVVMHANTSFLQMYLWEGIGVLAPKLIEYSTTMLSGAECVSSPRGTKNMFRARTLQWASVK